MGQKKSEFDKVEIKISYKKENADFIENNLLKNPDITYITVTHHLSSEREKYFDLPGPGICDERTHESHGSLPVMAGGRQLFPPSLRPVGNPGGHNCGKIKE